jgi:cation/acetate symporter
MPPAKIQAAAPRINPRLGTYFSIFVSAFLALAAFLMILEELGYPEHWMRLGMVLAPVVLAGVIGVATYSTATEDYFVAGRRVPAFCNGLIIAVTAIGGTGLLALTGLTFLIGVDALFISLGLYAGIVLAAVLLVPFLRKFGAYTVPSYLGLRFESGALRIVSAVVLSVVALLIVVAEMRVGAIFVKSFMRVDRSTLIWPVAVAMVVTILPGGVRSLSWSNTAWGLVALISLLVPVAILSVIYTNLPLPQIAYANVLSEVTRLEAVNRLSYSPADPLSFVIPGLGHRPMLKPYLLPYGSIGWMSFLIGSICIMFGTAASPALLMRGATSPDVLTTRKAMGWAAFILGLILLTIPAIAVFTRHALFLDIIGKAPDKIPEWFTTLVNAGRASLEPVGNVVALESVKVRRDTVLMILPSAGNMPTVVVGIATAGVIAAVCAAASSTLATLANMLSEDLVLRQASVNTPSYSRLLIARIALAGSALLLAAISLRWTIDPLKLFLWGLSIAASAVFPILVMSIWWKRVTRTGAVAGMITGAVIAMLAILRDEFIDSVAWFGIDGMLAGAFGAPAALIVTVGVSLLLPKPSKRQIDLVRDMRVPGGETIHDRMLRLSRSRTLGMR